MSCKGKYLVGSVAATHPFCRDGCTVCSGYWLENCLPFVGALSFHIVELQTNYRLSPDVHLLEYRMWKRLCTKLLNFHRAQNWITPKWPWNALEYIWRCDVMFSVHAFAKSTFMCS